MDATEKEAVEAQVAIQAKRIQDYDDLSAEIESLKAVQGTVQQVNIISSTGAVKVLSDSDIVAKAETALTNLIAAKETELANI